MEKKLEALFDYPKFERNPQLQQVIDEVHARYGARRGSNVRMLTMDEADMVAAAGTPGQESKNDEHRFGTGLLGVPGEGNGLPTGQDQ